MILVDTPCLHVIILRQCGGSEGQGARGNFSARGALPVSGPFPGMDEFKRSLSFHHTPKSTEIIFISFIYPWIKVSGQMRKRNGVYRL